MVSLSISLLNEAIMFTSFPHVPEVQGSTTELHEGNHLFTSNNGYAWKNTKDMQLEDKVFLFSYNAYGIKWRFNASINF